MSLPLLFVPQASPRLLMAYTIVHLAVPVGFGLLVDRDLSRFQDGVVVLDGSDLGYTCELHTDA